MFKHKKGLLFLSMLIVLLVIIPSSFAQENGTEIAIDEGIADVEGIGNQDNILKGSNDYYFDASAENDSGDGSIDHPYKYLKADRIKANSNIYLANGEYNLDKSKTIEQVNIIGTDTENTTIRYQGLAFTVSNSFTLTNVTILYASMENRGMLNATNTVFKYCENAKRDSYGNSLGGAICCPKGYNPTVNIKNCTFIENFAVYGASIYIYGGSLNISDSSFIGNLAYNFGGSIAAEYGTALTISRSKFLNSRSYADAGGAIYTRQISSLKLEKVDIINSTATFGGAIASLMTDFSANRLTVINCSAEWDGGAVYHLYGNFTSIYGVYQYNSASNGGALFIDNSTALYLMNNYFINNHANITAGAVYSLQNTIKNPLLNKNTYTGNTAFFENKVYIASSFNLNIGSGNYTMYRNNASEIDVLPSSYSLRDTYLTIPKDQESSGNCWAFTAIAVLESNILKASGPSLDLSEENMKNVIARYSDYGWTMDTNEGGYDEMPFGYYASWLGPVLESDDAFDDKSTLSPVLNSIAHVQNILLLKRDDYLDNDAIKEAIIKYGAVGTSMCFDSYYFRASGYYCWNRYSNNHAVTIVGWDDNYSRNNFYGLSSDKGDGAWIVRNSWGPSWNSNGYFYVSYYDETLAKVGNYDSYTFILNDTIRYEKNYQYDIAGKTDYYYFDCDALWYKNVFTAEGNEFVAAVSTYFEKLTNWTASVYVNGDLKVVKEGISNAGYYTFDLGQMIPLNAGDIFEVVFKVSSGDVNSIPISEKVSLNKLIYKPGISFFSFDGTNWVDLYNQSGTYGTHWYASQVACVKAFTILNEINTTLGLSVNLNENFVDIMASVVDQYGNLLNNGYVTFNLGGTDYVINVTNGIARMSSILGSGEYLISATFNASGYVSSSNSTSEFLIVNKNDVNMTANSYDVYVGENVTVDVVLPQDASGDVIAVIDDVNYYGLVENGTASIVIPDLPAGSYIFDVFYSGDDFYNGNMVTVNVTVVKCNTSIQASARTVRVDGNATVNVVLASDAAGNVSIIIDGVAYYGIVENGVASITLPILPAGSYVYDVVYGGDDKYNPNMTQVTFNVNKYKSSISASARSVRVDQGAVVNVVLPGNATGFVTIVVDGVDYSAEVVNGSAVIELPVISEAGSYAFDVAYDGDDYYKPSSSKVTFNVIKYPITLKATARTVRIGDDVVVNVALSKGDAAGEVVITVGGVDYVASVENGVAIVVIPNLPVGQYSLDVVYAGDDKFKPYTGVVTFNVNKYPITLKATARTVHIGDDVVVNVALSKGDAAGEVVITVGGVDYVASVENGVAIVVIPNLPVGQYSLDVVYAGDDKFKPYTGVVTFNVNKFKADMSVSARTVKVGDDVIVNVALNGDASGEVIITVNSTDYTASVENGVATVVIPNLPAGEYALGVSYTGDGKYKPTTSQVTFNVNKYNVRMKATARTVKVGNDVTVNVALSDDAGGNVTINIDGIDYCGVVDNGNAVIILPNLPVNQYVLDVYYSGDEKYKSYTSTVSFNVNK